MRRMNTFWSMAQGLMNRVIKNRPIKSELLRDAMASTNLDGG